MPSSDDEATPLLAHDAQPKEKRNTGLGRLLLILFLQVLGHTLTLAPRIQTYKNIICLDYTGKCKGVDAQAKLSFVIGVEDLLLVFMSFLFPAGFLVKRYGPSRVLSLALLSIILDMIWLVVFSGSFHTPWSIYWIWLGAVLQVCGGGITGADSMSIHIFGKVVSQESRRGVLPFLCSIIILANISGRFLSALLVYWDVLLPVYIGIGLSSMALALSLVPFEAAEKTNPVIGPMPESNTPQSDGTVKFWRHVFEMLERSPEVIVLLFCALIFTLGMGCISRLSLVYISDRYSWSIGDANLTLLFNDIALLFNHLSGHLLSNTVLITSYTRDCTISLIISVLPVAGALCMALAPTVLVVCVGITLLSFGIQLESMSRRLIGHLVHPQDFDLVYVMMNVTKRIGWATAGPMLAKIFALGMRLGGGWTGIHFFVSAAILSVGTVALMFLPQRPLNVTGIDGTPRADISGLPMNTTFVDERID